MVEVTGSSPVLPTKPRIKFRGFLFYCEAKDVRMIFNSIDFAIFLPVVFLFYWAVHKHHVSYQNLIVVGSSYVFYGWWDWRFLGLIIFSTLLDFFVALQLEKFKESRGRKALLMLSLTVNLGMLGFFKYFNFFLDSFNTAFSFFGQSVELRMLEIILPVGISFYTFQTLSYTIDVYRRKLCPTRNIIQFAAYVCFFPQLVAGPIERATNLLPQFAQRRTFNHFQATDGLRQILMGFFKKVVIADNCAVFVNQIFDNYPDYSGGTLALGAILFAFQIYGDFSGYSDIAIGTSRLFGFNLMQNFATPYFSRDIAEFWRRWHISLSTWFRDYLYIPLGGSKGGTSQKLRNTLIIFLVSGFWHGANWTFVIWGLLNAIYFIPLMLSGRNRKHVQHSGDSQVFTFREVLGILTTFLMTCLAWIFFRAPNVSDAIKYLERIFYKNDFFPIIPSSWGGRLQTDFIATIFVISLLIFIDWRGRNKPHSLTLSSLPQNKFYRWLIYILLALVLWVFSGDPQGFIYFQF